MKRSPKPQSLVLADGYLMKEVTVHYQAEKLSRSSYEMDK